MTKDFVERARPVFEPHLRSGEVLLGIVAATHQKTLSGSLYAIGVTEGRLLLQALDRRMQAKEAMRAIERDELVSAEMDGAGGGWWSAPAVVLDAAASRITLTTSSGEKLKLMMMNGASTLGGGEQQRIGVLALAEWMQRRFDGDSKAAP